MRSSVLLLALLLAATAGCFDDPTQPTVDRPILVVRSTSPADSSTNVYGPEPLNIGVSFNRGAEPDEVTLLLIPPPISSGPVVFSPGGRELGWLDVQLSPDPPAYRLLIDGPAVPVPHLVLFHTHEEVGITGRVAGNVSTSDRSLSAVGAVVFGLEVGVSGELDPALPQYLGMPVASIEVAVDYPALGGPWYQLSHLTPQGRYVALAILDTNQDGLYELERDWWGVHHPTGDPAPAEVIAGVDFDIPQDVDIVLEPPRAPSFLKR